MKASFLTRGAVPAVYAQGGAGPDQIPDIAKLTEGLSPTQTVIVVIAVAVISVAVFVVPRVWPERKQAAPAPAPVAQLTPTPGVPTVPPPPPLEAPGGVVTDEVKASRALLDRLVSGLEQQLADELARTERLSARYELVVEELRKQLSAAQEENWSMRDQVAELRRQISDLKGELENSHRHVVELQTQLRMHDDHRRYGQPGGRW